MVLRRALEKALTITQRRAVLRLFPRGSVSGSLLPKTGQGEETEDFYPRQE